MAAAQVVVIVVDIVIIKQKSEVDNVDKVIPVSHGKNMAAKVVIGRAAKIIQYWWRSTSIVALLKGHSSESKSTHCKKYLKVQISSLIKYSSTKYKGNHNY